jgi:hypothetical protein
MSAPVVMRMLRGVVLLLVVAQGLVGCGGSGSPSVPSAVPLPTPQPVPQPTPIQVTGDVFDTVNRALAGARVEVLDGPQAGTSTTSDPAGAFSLTGIFDGTTRFRASKEGFVAATQPFRLIVTSRSIFFVLDVSAGSVNIAGDYTLTFTADSACAGRLPTEVRTRTYAATIRPTSSLTRPANTQFTAAISGAELDTYYKMISIFVAGDYIDFDLSDNFLLEEVGPDTYLTIGGVGAASVGTSGVSTISASFHGLFDYCVTKAEPNVGNLYSCVPAEAIAHAQCASKNHRLILTRR